MMTSEEKISIMEENVKLMGLPMKKILLKRYGQEKGKLRWRKTRALYSLFMDEAPYIGGRENPMGFNLYQSLLVFAFYEACGKDLTDKECDELIRGVFGKKLKMLNKVPGKMLLNNKTVVKALYRFMRKIADMLNEKRGNEWNNTWGIKINPERHTEGFAMTLVGCPLADFAKSHGYMDILPKLCELDHTLARAMHVELVRKHTIAEGAEECDYWYVCGQSR